MTAKGNEATGTEIRTLRLPSGRPIPALGQGTWRMGENPARRQTEIDALRLGLDLGISLIDTAEMYGEGAAEELIGEAIADRRAEVFLVSKVYPHNATGRGSVEACERSLQRLGTDYLDLYLLHWRGAMPLVETLEAFQSLKQKGKIRDYGVSNFDVNDMEEAFGLPGGDEIVTNQVLYNLVHRGIERNLLPWCRDRGLPIMAYSPIGHSAREQRKLFDQPQVRSVASRRHVTPAQVALAWLLRRDVIAIPKASNPEHVRENRAALDLILTEKDLEELDQAFPAPRKKVALEIK
jgi:diketogulonate reductase-like aldo/keto reductase